VQDESKKTIFSLVKNSSSQVDDAEVIKTVTVLLSEESVLRLRGSARFKSALPYWMLAMMMKLKG